MLNFESDYTEGAHELILKKLMETNREQVSGYGKDPYTESAKEKIRQVCECPDGEVFLLTGGTQTNATIIDSLLRSYEGVIAAESGHIAVHEAGAIEASAHKVLTVPQKDGKIDPDVLRTYLAGYHADDSKEHMVYPGMVYISHPTESGTLYTAEELKTLHDICCAYEIPLFLDGARLGYGLMSEKSELTLPQIAKYTDVFYIGGTKVGALCGEAVVFTHQNMPKHFFSTVKRHGALLAKGRLLGVQFDVLFTDELYFKISRHAIEMAKLLSEGFEQRGYQKRYDSPTNQQFIVLSKNQANQLKKWVKFCPWERVDETHDAVRFATSWATTEEQVNELFTYVDRMEQE